MSFWAIIHHYQKLSCLIMPKKDKNLALFVIHGKRLKLNTVKIYPSKQPGGEKLNSSLLKVNGKKNSRNSCMNINRHPQIIFEGVYFSVEHKKIDKIRMSLSPDVNTRLIIGNCWLRLR